MTFYDPNDNLCKNDDDCETQKQNVLLPIAFLLLFSLFNTDDCDAR